MTDLAEAKATAAMRHEAIPYRSTDRARTEPAVARPRREEQIEIALEIDRLCERCEEASLPFVAYLLRVARAALTEVMGERPRR